MKRKIILILTLFITSTVLVAAEPLAKKTKPVDNSKDTQLNKVKPTKKDGVAKKTKPMKRKPRKPSEVQDQLQLLKEKFEADKRLFRNQYKSDLKMLKKRKKEAMDELKAEYRKKRALLRNK